MSSVEQIEPTPVYDAAERLARLGVSVIPILPGTKEPPPGFRWGEYAGRVADASERYGWFVERGWGLAVVAGEASGNLIPLDFDGPGGFEALAREHPVLRSFPRVRTGSGKHHVWVRSRQQTRKYNTTAPDGSRIEVRANTHYTLAPPSLHPNGAPYVWEVEPWDGIPVVALESIGLRTVAPSEPLTAEPIEEGEPLTEAEREHLVALCLPHWQPYQRHDMVLGLAGWLAGQGVPEGDTTAVVRALAEEGGDTARAREFVRAVRDTYRKARAGVAVSGWSLLTGNADPILPGATARQLDLLLRSRRPTFTFDAPAGATADTAPAHPYLVQVSDGLKEPRKPDVWLVDGLLRAESVQLIVGPPKTYKSFFAQELSIAVATGSPMFGEFSAGEPRRVLYVQEESPRSALWRRYELLLRGRGMHDEVIRDQLWAITNQGVRLDDPAGVERLIRDGVEACEPDLVIFDPLRELHWQDENKAEAMMPILRVFKELRDRYKVSVAVIHHNNKNPLYTSPADSIRGTSAIWAAVDGAVFIGTTDDESVMKVSLTLKEGGQTTPFLYSICEDDDALRFTIVHPDGRRGKFDRMQVVAWARERGDWWSIDDAFAAFPVSEKPIRDAVRELVRSGHLLERPARYGKKEYAHLEVDDDATF